MVPKPGEQPTDSDRRQQQGFIECYPVRQLVNEEQCNQSGKEIVAKQLDHTLFSEACLFL
jgi:hypothetical protein